MRKVITNTDIKKALGMKGFFGTCAAGALYGFCGMGNINRLFDGAADYQGREFADHLLENMNITFDMNPEQLSNIPEEGGFIVVSNHPFGGIEGVMLYSLIAKVRPDFKLMANFILSHIPNLKEAFFAVNPFTENPEWKSSVAGIKGAIDHVAKGNGLGIFPAGEVSRYHGHAYPEDLPWSNSVARIIKQAGVPVIPVYWDGRNSKLFYAMDKIHPMLGTSRLMRELSNKHDHCIPVRIGKPISPAEIADFEQPKELSAYLRSRTYALEAELQMDKPTKMPDGIPPVSHGEEKSIYLNELEGVREKFHLFSSANYECFLADYEEIPHLMYEIARLREETFRAIGEGSGMSIDIDEFDDGYKHLILWDNDKQRIVGSYRLGVGSEIIPQRGIKGFYVSTLFDFDERFSDILSKTIELGRSFVALDYQKEVLPLVLLLRGLAMVVLRYPEIEYFIGPVSISNWYPKLYQSLIAEYITRNHAVAPEVAAFLTPHTPFQPDFMKVDPDILLKNNSSSVDRFDKFLFRLSGGAFRLPTLFKKYLKLNAKVICLNIDPEFNNTLDALMLLKFTDFPEEEVIPLFSRDSSEEEVQKVRERFGYENREVNGGALNEAS